MVNNNLRKAALVLAVVALILLLICISLIGNAVRMAMHADRFLINTMQLVGATNWFIRRPLIWQNVVCGIIAAVLALGAIAALVFGGISQGITFLPHAIADLLLHPWPIAILVGCVVGPGILIPAIAAWFSAGRYLRKNVDDLYLM